MDSALLEGHLQHWEQVFAGRAWGQYPPEELVRFMARRFGARPDKARITVLEIGCGPGANLWYLAREGYAIAAIEGSPTALEQARARLQREGLERAAVEADLRQGNFAVLPWPDRAFDAVIDIEALSANRLAVIADTIAEIRRVLRPGGVVFAKMFGTETSGASSGTPIEPGTVAHPTEGPCAGQDLAHFFTEEELRGLFAGFTELTLDSVRRTDRGAHAVVFEWLVSARL